MANSGLPTVLESLVNGRRSHLDGIRERIAHVDPATLPRSTRSLYDSLGGGEGRGLNRFIMECKSASPSLGLIRTEYDPAAIASVYSRYASGISVLCEPDRFGGDYNHLATVAATTQLPVLCKDFIIDEVQVHAARYYGADAILLMMSVLSDADYSRLSAEADRLSMDVLTEAITPDEVDRALRLGAKILGINHRNLHDLTIDLSRSAALTSDVPTDVVVVSESGIRDNATVRDLSEHSNGFLVGSQLTSQPDIDRAARMLVYGPNKVCGLTRPSAAQSVRAAGAIYGGLVFEDASSRNVSRETASKIIEAEPGLNYVAVSRRTTGWSELDLDGVTAVQVHAPYQQSVEAEIALLDNVRREVGHHVEVWRAVSMSTPGGSELAKTLVSRETIDHLVLDSGNGGTGTTFDWTTIPEEVKAVSLLAGGIGTSNVQEALTVGCAGIDLNSGVEYAPGEKDAAAVRAALTTIRNYSK